MTHSPRHQSHQAPSQDHVDACCGEPSLPISAPPAPAGGCCCHDHEQAAGVFNLRPALTPIIISASLFLVGLIFHQPLSRTPFAIAAYAVLLPAYLISGWGVLTAAGRNIVRGQIFDENFLMTLATLGAIAIQELP